MGRSSLRVLCAIVLALGIAVAVPLHAFAMPQSCAQMTEDRSAKTSMDQAAEAAGQSGGGDMGTVASMDCAQHCSTPGTANREFDSLPHPADAAMAGSTLPLMPVLPELEPSPPRPGIAA